MATYIPGLTDYIPQIQEFKPDYNFYNKALQMRQSKYDAAHEQLSTLYGSLLNSPMLREKNVAERDQFFKVIDQDIKKMSSLDLSKQQNVQAASTIFNQMLDNKSIVKDMTWTRNWQKQHQKADAMRNCVDPEKCGGSWWQGGVDYLNYQAEDFKNATDDEAMGFGNARYVASQNITDMAMKVAKDLDLNIKVDTRKDGFIVTTKNGMNAVKPLYTMLAGKIGNDPKVLDYLQAKNYVSRKNWIKSNTPVYGSEEAATSEYIKQRSLELKDTLKKHQINIDFTADNMNQEVRNLEEKAADGIPATEKDLADVYNDVLGIQSSVQETSAVIKDANDNFKQAEVNNFSKATLRSLDRAGILSDLERELATAAQTLASKDYEQTIKVDPYALESVRQANRKALEIDRYYLKAGLQDRQFQLDMLEKQYESKGTLFDNQAIQVEAGKGAVVTNLGDDASWNYITEETYKNEKALSQNELLLIDDFFNASTKQSKAKGGVANEDLVNFMDSVMGAFQDSNNYKNETKIPDSLKERFRKWNSYTKEQKLAGAKAFDLNYLQLLRGSVIDEIYDNDVAPFIDMSNPKNVVSRDYLSSINTNRQANIQEIDEKNQYLDALSDTNKEVAQSVINQLGSGNEFAEFKDYIDLFIDDSGIPLSRDKFASAYMKKLVSEANAAEQPLTETGMQELYFEGLDVYDDIGEDVENEYKRLYNQTIKESAGTYRGFGSYEVEYADMFPAVDASKHTSTNTQDMNTFVNSFRQAKSPDYRVAMGYLESELPEETDDNAKDLLDFVLNNWQRRTSAKDKKRPILTTTYQHIAGGNKDWNALNIKVNPEFVDTYKGSENLPGLTRDQYEKLTTEGFTVYTNKENVLNNFSQKAGKTTMEKLVDLSKDGYKMKLAPQYSKATLKKVGENRYQVEGQAAIANKETGELVWGDVPPNYVGNDVNLLYQAYEERMILLEAMNNKILREYNKTRK